MNPSDFFVDVVDFFAVLVPGAAATYLLIQGPAEGLVEAYNLQAGGWVAFAVASYLAGHLIFLFGARLDPFYDRWRRRTKPTSRDAAFQAARGMHEECYPSLAGGALSTFKWSKAYVRLRSRDAIREIERFEAAAKLFRSVSVLFAFTSAYVGATAKTSGPAWSATFLALAVMSFLRFCDQRWKSTELAYTYVLLLRDVKLAEPA